MENTFSLSPFQRELRSGCSLVGSIECPAPRELSPAEERLWLIEQLEPGVPVHNVPVAFRLEGRLDAVALEQALDEIVRRHEPFRTAYAERAGRVTATAEGSRSFTLLLIDLSSLLPEERETHAAQIMDEEARRPVDLQRGFLVRARLLRLAEQEHILLLVTHAIACDEESMALLKAELTVLYDGYSSHRLSLLPDLASTYSHFALSQRERIEKSEFASQLAFWQRQLAGLPKPLCLPEDRLRSSKMSGRGATHSFRFPRELLTRLHEFSRTENVTPFVALLAIWKTLLHRYSRQNDVIVGSAISHRSPETKNLIGAFSNTLALRTDFSDDPSVRELLQRTRAMTLEALAHGDLPFQTLLQTLSAHGGAACLPLFQTQFSLRTEPLPGLTLSGLRIYPLPLHNQASSLDLKLALEETTSGLNGVIEYNAELFDETTVLGISTQFQTLFSEAAAHPEKRVSTLSLLSESERRKILGCWNGTIAAGGETSRIHERFERQATRTPAAAAVVFGEQKLSYQELDRNAATLAAELGRNGVGPGVRVGLMINPSAEMIIGLLAVLKTGGAYIPFDPLWSEERFQAVLKDSGATVLVTQSHLLERSGILLNAPGQCPGREEREDKTQVYPGAAITSLASGLEIAWIRSPQPREEAARSPDAEPSSLHSLVCVGYDALAVGEPNGVLLTHGNAVEFLDNMDRLLGRKPVVWLSRERALEARMGWELLWPLTHGGRIVIHDGSGKTSGTVAGQPRLETYSPTSDAEKKSTQQSIDFSLFYFSSEANGSATDSYRLLLEGAKFADAHDFTAVWTPERHFHAFGGLYPSPSVTSAALAMITKRIHLRAGSVVLPLHHPVRVAEEWSVVDNLSGGRVGLSFASGWHANDFIFAPERYSQRQQILLRDIDVIRRLWRGESVASLDGAGKQVDIRILPRPVQAELPFWITSSGRAETFRKAGEAGAGVLTHLLGQTPADLASKIGIYRAARKEAGHPGEGHVVLMLHTFVGRDAAAVKEKVRKPFSNYLRNSLDLIQGSPVGMEAKELSPEDLDVVVGFAFERYFETSGLFGTPEVCRQRAEELKAIGVDEIACLIDFGVDTDSVLESLSLLNEVRLQSNGLPLARDTGSKDEAAFFSRGTQDVAPSRPLSLAQCLLRDRVDHLQCTAQQAAGLLEDPDGARAILLLDKLLLVGEPPSASLLKQLHERLSGELLYLRGQLETGLWFTGYSIGENSSGKPLGRRLGNAWIYILDQHLQLVPPGVPGELFVGGPGLALGYQRGTSDLGGADFVVNPFPDSGSPRLFRTGDIARLNYEGTVEFMGRQNRLAAIESILLRQAGVREAVVIASDRKPEPARMIAFVAPLRGPSRNSGVEELRLSLEQALRDHEESAELVFVDALPRTAEGQVDRSALSPSRVPSTVLNQAFALPRTSTEEAVGRIWSEVLGVKYPGVHDDFFEQGGHSLLLVRVGAQIRETFQVELSLAELSKVRTISALSSLIEERLLSSIEPSAHGSGPSHGIAGSSSVTVKFPNGDKPSWVKHPPAFKPQ